jgi:hypothetical protein
MDEIVSHRAVLDSSGAITIICNSVRRIARQKDWVIKHSGCIVDVLSAKDFENLYEPASTYEEANAKNNRPNYKRTTKSSGFNPWKRTTET